MGETSWFTRLDTNYRSETQISDDERAQLKSKTVVDWRVGMTTDQFEVTAYLDNAFNNKVPNNAIDFVNFAQNFQELTIAFPAEKRTAGLRVKYNF